MATRREKIVSLGNALANRLDTEEELIKKIEQVLNDIGELNYKKQEHEQALHVLECQLHEKETLVQALSYARLIVSQRQEKEGVNHDGQ
ncbi:hypothetical protein [Priestia megaterium]|uniref:hypothetical protein n=1 Tax=Priestia megaterium TaxID=1404 RepID=UPI00372D11ED